MGQNSGVTFTKAEITEHGSGFLAEAAQQIHHLRASLQCKPDHSSFWIVLTLCVNVQMDRRESQIQVGVVTLNLFLEEADQ